MAAGAGELGYPVVIKPVMSSSGKGQCVAQGPEDLDRCWEISQSGGRSGAGRIIIEEFVRFTSEITLLTLRTVDGTLYCDPVGHRQQGGDYVESWQPHAMDPESLARAREMAARITADLGGRGIFGVEFFLLEDGGVLFSEVSPRPHDTGMVTMCAQQWSQFALHARAILGLPVREILRYRAGASAAVKADRAYDIPVFTGLEECFNTPGLDLRIFGKPVATPGRRMGVVLASAGHADEALELAKAGREKLRLSEGSAPD